MQMKTDINTVWARVICRAGCVLGSVMLAALAGGCVGTAESESEVVEEESIGTVKEAVQTDNGLSENGLSVNGQTVNGLTTNGQSTNGLSTNGLSTNGLSTNGLSTNGLSTNGFNQWFNAGDKTYPAMVMRYIVRCALPAGQTRTYTDPEGYHYTWYGSLGLAPNWAGGAPISVVEQQMVSACLAAHTNMYGRNIPISVLGRHADGSEIPLDPGEDTMFPEPEGCFFGNIFNGDGVFSGYDDGGNLQKPGKSSGRGCALKGKPVAACAPMEATGASCADYCVRSVSNPAMWESCTFRGKTYKPITTRVRPAEIYSCGDGVCQFTESCEDTRQTIRCASDCGC